MEQGVRTEARGEERRGMHRACFSSKAFNYLVGIQIQEGRAGVRGRREALVGGNVRYAQGVRRRQEKGKPSTKQETRNVCKGRDSVSDLINRNHKYLCGKMLLKHRTDKLGSVLLRHKDFPWLEFV